MDSDAKVIPSVSKEKTGLAPPAPTVSDDDLLDAAIAEVVSSQEAVEGGANLESTTGGGAIPAQIVEKKAVSCSLGGKAAEVEVLSPSFDPMGQPGAEQGECCGHQDGSSAIAAAEPARQSVMPCCVRNLVTGSKAATRGIRASVLPAELQGKGGGSLPEASGGSEEPAGFEGDGGAELARELAALEETDGGAELARELAALEERALGSRGSSPPPVAPQP
jgi:hypothetical protein